jgi:hypothetical protein
MDDDIKADIEELKEKITELTELVEESHRMIKNLYQRARLATVVVFIKWFVIIGLTVGSFYFIGPLLSNLAGIYGGVGNVGSILGNTPPDNSSATDTNPILDILKKI